MSLQTDITRFVSPIGTHRPLLENLYGYGNGEQVRRVRIFVRGDSNYQGGYTLAPSAFGFTAFLETPVIEEQADSQAIWSGIMNGATLKLLTPRSNNRKPWWIRL